MMPGYSYRLLRGALPEAGASTLSNQERLTRYGGVQELSKGARVVVARHRV